MPWQEVVALASSQHRCQTILVRVENRERLGLAPIRQAYDPQTHQAKCLACPTFYACAPRRRSLFAGSLQELFCGRACREAYACQTSAQGLRRVVFARDGGVCALCGADGHALVEAGAGSGKTRLLVKIACECEGGGRRALVLAYNKAAQLELGKRCVREAKTFHAFGLAAWKEHLGGNVNVYLGKKSVLLLHALYPPPRNTRHVSDTFALGPSSARDGG